MGWLWLVSKVKCSPNDGAMQRISSLWSLLFASFGRYSQWRDDKNLAGNMLNPLTASKFFVLIQPVSDDTGDDLSCLAY